MIEKDRMFVLGAQDPEMREIEKTLASAGFTALHAARRGQRCSAQTAYTADGVVRVGPDGVPRAAVLPPRAPAVFVECTVDDRTPVLRVDHHNPGDPGYEEAGGLRQLSSAEPAVVPTLPLLAAMYRRELHGSRKAA